MRGVRSRGPNIDREYKRPESVLVVAYSRAGRVLLLRRTNPPGFWQSVTGSLRWPDEAPNAAARRELREETGLSVGRELRDWHRTYQYEIPPAWRERYAPGTRFNTEHVFSLQLPNEPTPVLDPDAHDAWAWLDFAAAAERATSWTNREVIKEIDSHRRGAENTEDSE